jgi:hypothetical protein
MSHRSMLYEVKNKKQLLDAITLVEKIGLKDNCEVEVVVKINGVVFLGIMCESLTAKDFFKKVKPKNRFGQLGEMKLKGKVLSPEYLKSAGKYYKEEEINNIFGEN